jgi:hypothetical protein
VFVSLLRNRTGALSPRNKNGALRQFVTKAFSATPELAFLARAAAGGNDIGVYKASERQADAHAEEVMAPFKRKPPQPAMSKAELRAQGVQALAQVTTPITKLPMKIRRQCKDCGRFNSVLVEPGEAVPAFKCSTCS